MYFYNAPQNAKGKNRIIIKVLVVLFVALLIFFIGMRLGQYYENRPANIEQVENFANEMNQLNNPGVLEELKTFRKLYPSPSQKQLDSFRDYLKLRREMTKPTIALPESDSYNSAKGVTINSPGVDYQSLSVSATALKIGQFVMDANNCIYVVQNGDNDMKVIPALDTRGQQYCPANL